MQLSVSEIEGLIFGELGAPSYSLQKLESQVRSQCFLDHLVVAFAGASCRNFGGSQQIVFQIHGRLSLHFFASLTEKRFSFKMAGLGARRRTSSGRREIGRLSFSRVCPVWRAKNPGLLFSFQQKEGGFLARGSHARGNDRQEHRFAEVPFGLRPPVGMIERAMTKETGASRRAPTRSSSRPRSR